MKFGDWLYADGPSRPRQQTGPSKYSGPQPSRRAMSPGAPTQARNEQVETEILDTMTSPLKQGSRRMEVAREARERLNMDAVGDAPSTIVGTPKALLGLTDGSGIDGHENN